MSLHGSDAVFSSPQCASSGRVPSSTTIASLLQEVTSKAAFRHTATSPEIRRRESVEYLSKVIVRSSSARGDDEVDSGGWRAAPM